MFSVKGDSTVASVTELRRETKNLLNRVEGGESVVIQKNRDAVGILIGYEHYSRMMDMMAKLEDLEMALLAIKREEAILRGDDELHDLDDVLAEFGLSDATE